MKKAGAEKVLEVKNERNNEISEDNPTSESWNIFVESINSQRPKNYHSIVQNYFTKNTGCKKVLSQFCKNEYSYLGTMRNYVFVMI